MGVYTLNCNLDRGALTPYYEGSSHYPRFAICCNFPAEVTEENLVQAKLFLYTFAGATGGDAAVNGISIKRSDSNPNVEALTYEQIMAMTGTQYATFDVDATDAKWYSPDITDAIAASLAAALAKVTLIVDAPADSDPGTPFGPIVVDNDLSLGNVDRDGRVLFYTRHGTLYKPYIEFTTDDGLPLGALTGGLCAGCV